ncbi:MAG: hypothetical protein Q8P64_14600 [Deltaproteobacteria bacterium]|nr:hypothetical protein [Deltaproteobacteria bacterium]
MQGAGDLAADALIMFCGMTVFNIFAESVNGSAGIVTLLSMAVFQLGYFWFMKNKWGFADVL